MKLPFALGFLTGMSIIIYILCSFILNAVHRVEHHECLMWEADEAIYNMFYSPAWAKDECKQFNINLK